MDLSTIFKAVSANLSEQQSVLNEADTNNHDHGDNMVQIFNLIQNAVSQKSKEPVEKQLAFASKAVEKGSESGSAKFYSEGLAKAAKNFSGQELEPNNLGLLVKSLLNVEEPPKEKAESNLLGSLLSGIAGTQQTTKKEEPDLLGSLLSGFAGKQEAEETDKKFGMDDVLRAGMAYFQSKQQGSSDTEAIFSALMAASPLGQSAHRSQSGALVAKSILGLAGSFLK